MKIMFWNVNKGFRPGKGFDVDYERLEVALEIVSDVNPDVLILNEADYIHDYHESALDYKKWFDFSEMYGHQYAAHMANCILSKMPLEDGRTYIGDGRTGVCASVSLPNGRLAMATFHTQPGSTTASKVKDIVGTARLSGGPCLFAGDFNAISPDDDIDIEKLSFNFREISMDKASEVVAKKIEDGNAIFDALHLEGFRDLVGSAQKTHTMPSWLPCGSWGTQVRIDHVLANHGVIGSAYIITDPKIKLASDHRPIVAEVDLK